MRERNLLKTVLMVPVVALLFCAMGARPAFAACSEATLDGDYHGNLTGTNASGSVAAQVTSTFNGDGTGTASITLMTESSGPLSFTSTVTYTLGSDCSGTMTSQRSTGETTHYVIVAVSKGSEIYLLATDPGSVITGISKSTK